MPPRTTLPPLRDKGISNVPGFNSKIEGEDSLILGDTKNTAGRVVEPAAFVEEPIELLAL